MVKRKIEFYNLDVIISVGYRVKSKRGTKFRQWANKVLKEYLLRGYVVNTRIAGRRLFAYIRMQETGARKLLDGIR